MCSWGVGVVAGGRILGGNRPSGVAGHGSRVPCLMRGGGFAETLLADAHRSKLLLETPKSWLLIVSRVVVHQGALCCDS